MMKNKLVTLLISLSLICPLGFNSTTIYAELADNTEQTETTENTQLNKLDDEENVVTEQNNVEGEINQEESFKKPISKKKIIKKFLLAMFGVTVSSFLIFFVLTLYNKVRYRVINKVKTPEGETTLKTPDNINEAVQIFLEKTQWK